jgi:hypothetical protein
MQRTTAEKELEGLEQISDEQWEFYKEVIHAVRDSGEPFALGGGFAWAAFTGVFRNGKDIDLFILPESREKLIQAISKIGLTDYFEKEGYDRKWIYRGTRDGWIADLIWDMANYRANLDPDWVTLGPKVIIRGEHVRVLPIEELIWNKLYILQRPRCDWTDILNLIYLNVESIDWGRMIKKLAPDAHLLGGALNVFQWMCPGRAKLIPSYVWQMVGLLTPDINGEPDYIKHRVDLLDSRPWFIPALNNGELPFSTVPATIEANDGDKE